MSNCRGASAFRRRPACAASSGWRTAGIIRGYRALLNSPALGMDVVAFCLIGLNHQSETELKAFADRTRGWPIVRAAWMVSGESDFLLHCVASDLATFQNFVIEELTSTPNVDTVRTALTIRQVKDEGMVAIAERGRAEHDRACCRPSRTDPATQNDRATSPPTGLHRPCRSPRPRLAAGNACARRQARWRGALRAARDPTDRARIAWVSAAPSPGRRRQSRSRLRRSRSA